MTRPPLRLVLDQGEDTAATAMELPSAGSADLHVHLHIGTPEPQELRSAGEAKGRPEKGRWQPALLGGAGVLIALVAFDVGARSGEGHARALAASRSNVAGLASPMPGPERPLEAPASPNEMPAPVRQQLAQPPTITPPPNAPGGAANPFGLHP